MTFEVDVLIVGLGYVGIPLAEAACNAGLKVKGLDLNTNVVENLNNGISHVDDLSDQDVSDMLSRGFSATSDPSFINTAEVIVICVPTPLSVEGGPDLGAVIGATKSIAQNLRPGSMVILESTTYP